MKKNNILYCLSIAMILFPLLTYAQGGDLLGKINSWKTTLLQISRAVIGIAAIGGGVFTYFKVQTSSADEGKKSIGNYLMALVFAALFQSVIEFFLSE